MRDPENVVLRHLALTIRTPSDSWQTVAWRRTDVPGLRKDPVSVGAGVVAILPGWLLAVRGKGL